MILDVKSADLLLDIYNINNWCLKIFNFLINKCYKIRNVIYDSFELVLH